MASYIPDILSNRWVIVSPQRLSRPADAQGVDKQHCVFCPGNEHLTPPEVLRYGGGEPNKPGWSVRVIPNKFPITDIHEVFIHSPEGERDIAHLELPQVELILKAYRERYNFYRGKGKIMIFCNHGYQGGASLRHPHSQLVVIPSQIHLDTLAKEPINNLIFDGPHFVAYCPAFSQWPYELWLAPKKENTVFGDMNDEELKDLAHLLQKSLQKLEKIFDKHNLSHLSFGYNYYIYYKENWYLRIIPRFINRAGFELGTGLSVNIIDPRDAAEELAKG